MNKKFVVLAAVLIYLISAYFSYDLFSSQGGASQGKSGLQTGVVKNVNQAKINNVNPENFEGPKTEECPLTGELLTKQHKDLWESRRPLGIMIENHTDARPQSGLSSADTVYEFVAEGGITRFLAIFYCKDAQYVGPVRSARIYFMSMLQAYGANPLYAHVGGANAPGPADALGTINKLGWGNYNDMNQFSIPFPTYYRDYDRNPGVATEHTMYSSTQKLWKFAAEKRKLTNKDEEGEAWDKDFSGWEFKDSDPVSATNTTKISYDFWTGKKSWSVAWDYDKATNSYKRSHGDGESHVDKNTKKQLAAKNVIVALMQENSANDGYPGGHRLFKTLGSGKAYIFQNGEAIEGTWKKKEDEDMIRFYDKSGKEVELVRGQTWVSAIDDDNEVI